MPFPPLTTRGCSTRCNQHTAQASRAAARLVATGQALETAQQRSGARLVAAAAGSSAARSGVTGVGRALGWGLRRAVALQRSLAQAGRDGCSRRRGAACLPLRGTRTRAGASSQWGGGRPLRVFEAPSRRRPPLCSRSRRLAATAARDDAAPPACHCAGQGRGLVRAARLAGSSAASAGATLALATARRGARGACFARRECGRSKRVLAGWRPR